MNNKTLQTFTYEDFQYRVITTGNETFTVASDLAKILGYHSAKDMTRILDDDEKGMHEVPTLGGIQKMLVITEAGIYKAIMNREIAYVKDPQHRDFVHRFQRWVTHEVLPSIRKHGGYINGQEHMTAEQMILASMHYLQSKISEQQAQLEAQQPQVEFAKAVEQAQGDMLVGELAIILRQNSINIGGTRLFQWLREHGYLIKRKGTDSYNRPTQYAVEHGLMRIKKSTIKRVNAGGNTFEKTTFTPMITPKGAQYFIHKFLND